VGGQKKKTYNSGLHVVLAGLCELLGADASTGSQPAWWPA
jgi:hypothetical protein